MKACDVFVWLVERGVRVTARALGEGIAYEPVDGFYKSDGLAYFVDGESGPELRARYNEVRKLESPWDVVRASKWWHEFSEDRLDGWRIPPPHWSALYEELTGASARYTLTDAGKAHLEGLK